MNIPFKRILPITILLIFCIVGNSLTFAENPILENYKNNRNKLHPIQQRTNAVQTISTEQESEVLKEALEDILKYSSTQEENQDALLQIGAVLAKLPETITDQQKVKLYKARVLRRLGRMEEGNAIFDQAYNEKWPQFQYENERSLLERGDFAGAALHEYDRVSGRLHGTFYQVPPYEEGIEDLGMFKLNLGRLKENNPEPSTADNVIAKLNEQSDISLMKEFAIALCLSEYGRFPEAWEIINKVESNRDIYGDTPAWKDISLYKSMILLDEGKDVLSAQAEFRKFMAAHGDNYKVIYYGGDRFARSLENAPEKIAKADEVTILLIESPIIRDEAVKQTFSPYEIAHLYDVHHMGLAWSGKLDEGAEICKFVYASYFPNLPAACCGVNYALYISQINGGDLEGAMDILNNIAEKAPFDTTMPFLRIVQSEILLKKGLRLQAFNLVQEAIMRCMVNDGGSHRNARKIALELQKRILEKH